MWLKRIIFCNKFTGTTMKNIKRLLCIVFTGFVICLLQGCSDDNVSKIPKYSTILVKDDIGNLYSVSNDGFSWQYCQVRLIASPTNAIVNSIVK